MLVNRSVAQSQAGRLAAARSDVEGAARDYQTVGGDIERAMAVHNAGYIALLEGDLVSALETMAEAHGVLAAASAVNAAICDLDRAEVLRDAGLAREAEQSLARVVTVFGAHRMRQAKGEAEFHLARSLLSARSRQVRTRGRRRQPHVPSHWERMVEIRADAVRLRALLRASRDEHERSAGKAPGSAAAAEVDVVAGALEAKNLRAEAAALRLSRELWLAASTRRRSAAGDNHATRRPDPGGAARARGAAPRAPRLTGGQSGARRHAAPDSTRSREWQQSFGSLDLQTSVVMHGNGLIRSGLSSAVRSGRPDMVFEWSERARHLSQQVVPLRPPPDEALAADLAELRMLRAETGGLAGDTAGARPERARAERQWSATGSAGRRDRISLDERAAALDGRHRHSSRISSTAATCWPWSSPPRARAWSRSGGGRSPSRPRRAARRPRCQRLRALRPHGRSRSSARSMTAWRRFLGAPRRRIGGDRRSSARDHRAGGPQRNALGDAARHRGRPFTLATSATAGWPIAARAGRAWRRARRRPARPPRAEEVAAVASAWSDATVLDPDGDRRGGHADSLRRSTSCTSPRMAGTRSTTRCSRVWSSPTARCSATTST